MMIEGPLKFAVMEHENRPGYELHVTFTPEFRAMALDAQGASFRDYLGLLNREIPLLGAEDRNRAGMLLVQQLVEQMLPHVEAGELALEDTTVVAVGPETPLQNLVDLLN